MDIAATNWFHDAKRFLQEDVQAGDIERLRDVIREADRSYYVEDHPLLADEEYDRLFAKLKQLEAANPELITADSPTRRVAKGLNAAFPSVAHLLPMLSLENSYNEQDLIDWDKRCREASGAESIHYCVEPKFDGAGISLLYESNMLQRGATRGDGVMGDDITMNTLQIRSIPIHAALHTCGIQQMELRGEVLLTKKAFQTYNHRLLAEGLAPLANPRNAASGSLRLKDPNEVSKRNLDSFLYHISYIQFRDGQDTPPGFRTHYDTLQTLHTLGFKTSYPYTRLVQGIEEVIASCRAFEATRDDLPYEIDGAVIKVNSFELQEQIGQTSHHPRWAMAFKFKARQATSTLLQIDYQVGRTGSITPVAKIQPVAVGGVTISSLSLFNEEVIREKDLRIGDTLLIERAGDVIPYVVKSFPELRTGKEIIPDFPTHCPVCAQPLYRPEGEAVWRCNNTDCSAQVIERIRHFASKDAMDIRGMGEALVSRFVELGYLHRISDLYRLPFEQIRQLEGLGEKSAENLKEAIERSKSQPLNRLIFGLGIRYVGETTAKTLACSVHHLRELAQRNVEELCTLEDVGIKVASSIVEFFSHPDNLTLLQELERCGVQVQQPSEPVTAQQSLQGKTFLFTGTLSMKRQEAEAMVEARGGVILGGVSSKLHYLVVGEDAGSKLEKAKKLGTIHILSEEAFRQLMAEEF